MKRRILTWILAVLAVSILAGSVVWSWNRWARPTRIAFVNYTDFQYARFQSADTVWNVQLERVDPAQDSTPDLSRQDLVLVFAHGLNLSEGMRFSLRRAAARGVGILCVAATSAENDMTTLEGEDLQQVESYLDNGGKENFARLYAYVRSRMQHAWIAAAEPQPALSIPADVFFHLDEQYFASLQEYETWRRSRAMVKDGAFKVVLFPSVAGPRNAGRTDMDSLIVALESKGFNVYPIDGFGKRIEWMDSIAPDLVISLPHGRLVPGKDKEIVDWLVAHNTPLLAPLKVFEEYSQWRADQRGMDGGMLGQSVVVPELDGAVEAFAISAQFLSDDGYLDFRPIPGRIHRFVNRVDHWLRLKRMSNADKKVAIVYLKGPGQNALVAGGLEVLPSLYALLVRMKAEGYTVDGLPRDEKQFESLVQKQGMVPGPYAHGTIETMLREGNPERIPVGLYQKWAQQALPDTSWKQVLSTYGPAPGPYMSTGEGDSAEILVNRIVFGNVAILPQPLPGYGDNEFALVHGVKVPPPHPYIAAYLWAEHGFRSDALIHFGTHGSFEFLPSKQVALSDEDWPDNLIGSMPHGYVYLINNIGEAMMAKRRGYATMLSHLTPPFFSAGLAGDLQALHDKLHHYLLPDLDPGLRHEYAATLKQQVLALSMDKDLGIHDLQDRDLTSEEIDRIHNHVHVIEQEKVGKGLYVLGRPYSAEEADETARLMHMDVVAYSLAQLDVSRGLVLPGQLENRHWFEQHYRLRADTLVNLALRGGDALARALSLQDRALLAAEDARSRSPQRIPTHSTSVVDTSSLSALVASVAADDSGAAFVRRWSSSAREYQRVAALLDPGVRSRFEKAAGFVPEMARILELVRLPGMMDLVAKAQDSSSRHAVLALLDNPDLRRQLAEIAQTRQNALQQELSSPDALSRFSRILQTENKHAWSQEPDSSDLKQSLDLLTKVLQNQELAPVFARDSLVLAKARQSAESRLTELRDQHEQLLAELHSVRDALRSVRDSRDALLASTERELSAVVRFLDGGYIEPSPGGDPIANPEAVPTGRNLYAINAENTPTREAWETGRKMVDALLVQEKQSRGDVPHKVALTLWGGEFVRDQGTTIAQALWLMGVEPVWNARGRMHDVRLVPLEKLGRPRIDVLVQTSGQFRDLGASRLYLLNKAVRLASEAPVSEFGLENHVRQGTEETARSLRATGTLAPERADKLARMRIFGGVNGNYGTGIMGLVESGDRWESETEIQDRYIQNMGAIYDSDEWGRFEQGLFRTALERTEVVLQSRSSNVTGPISLDHTYEFMGGLSSAIRGVTGKDPRAYFTDTRNRSNPMVQDAKEAIWVEARSTLLNPRYVQALAQGGASSAEMFAEAFRNTYGWDVMKPTVIDDELWNSYYEFLVEDKQQLGLKQFFARENPYALQEMTAVMLETIRKGYWKASAETVQQLARMHGTWVKEHGAGCSGFVCDNPKLKAFIQKSMEDAELSQVYDAALRSATEASTSSQATRMQKEEQRIGAEKVPVWENTLSWIMGVLALCTILGGVLYKWRRRRVLLRK